MAWINIENQQIINLDKVDQVIKRDYLNTDTTYTYWIQYTYKDCSDRTIVYEQKFETKAARDGFFLTIDAALDTIKE